MLKRGGKPKEPSTSDSAFWPDTKRLLKAGAVTPFVSNFVSYDIFGGDVAIVAQTWAQDVKSPFPAESNRDLARVAQFYSVKINNYEAKRHYLNSLKSYLFGLAGDDPAVDPELLAELQENYEERTFSDIARQLGYPKFKDEQQNPLRLLAELPLPIYLTTSYHDFLEVALTKARKRPVMEILYWHNGLNRLRSIFDDQPNFKPTVDTPLVYHLYGLDKHPGSLVLTEDDYLDFLIEVSLMRADVQHAERLRGLPSSVRLALAGTSLLMLGYGVYDWEFRALFKGLVQANNDSRANQNKPKSILVQVQPDEGDSAARIKQYLTDYFGKSSFNVYWGSVNACAQELWQLWQGT